MVLSSIKTGYFTLNSWLFSLFRLQTDIPQPFAHLQIVQRLREYQEISGTNRQLLDTDHPANPQKSSRSPVRGVEDDASESVEKQWEQLRAAEKEGVLKLAPDDEIEGEILVLQNSLLSCAEENRLHCGMHFFCNIVS